MSLFLNQQKWIWAIQRGVVGENEKVLFFNDYVSCTYVSPALPSCTLCLRHCKNCEYMSKRDIWMCLHKSKHYLHDVTQFCNRHLVMHKVLCFHHELSYSYGSLELYSQLWPDHGEDRKRKSSSGRVNMLKQLWESNDEKRSINNCCDHIILEKTAPELSFHRAPLTEQTSNYWMFFFNEGETMWGKSCLHYSHCPSASGNIQPWIWIWISER